MVTITSQNREAEDVKDEIIRECEVEGVQYLLMGSRGMGNLIGKILLGEYDTRAIYNETGSTTEYCVKFAPVPVMIVKKNTPDTGTTSHRASFSAPSVEIPTTVAPVAEPSVSATAE